ncbi:ATP synthase F1 subunit delta [Candidatus Uhrbacteria bacterium]|nr:ATP synthase F1 subunit delta [Candidatus Uhrbacteria bacterium]
MKLSPKKYAESLLALYAQYSHKDVEQAIEHMVRYFTRRGKLKFLRMVLQELSQAIRKQHMHIDAILTSAHEIGTHAQNEIQHALTERFSGTVTLTHSTDPDLIAGSIITIEDRMIDCSLASRLHSLASRLSS